MDFKLFNSRLVYRDLLKIKESRQAINLISESTLKRFFSCMIPEAVFYGNITSRTWPFKASLCKLLWVFFFFLVTSCISLLKSFFFFLFPNLVLIGSTKLFSIMTEVSALQLFKLQFGQVKKLVKN